MENNLEEDVKEIEQKLPRKKKYSSIAAYGQPKEFTIPNPGIRDVKFKGDYNCILMYYNPLALKNPPKVYENGVSMFSFAFELFYDTNRTAENHSIPREIRGSCYELITIPEKNPRMIVYFNTVRKNMWLAYKKDDKEAEKIIKGFIKKLRKN